MKFIFKIVFFIILTLALFYLTLREPEFPQPPQDFIQSEQPADLETSLRRGYYTNLGRQEVIAHYQKQFENSLLNGKIKFLTYRLNYPPEEAQVLIRDQTASTFLEEIVHPFRESIYINGYEPKDPTMAIGYKQMEFKQKVIVKTVGSNFFLRVTVTLLAIMLIKFILTDLFSFLRKNVKYI